MIAASHCSPQRFVIRHSGGHIIPGSTATAARVADFLAHVQQQLDA
jgi:hypothetical protein